MKRIITIAVLATALGVNAKCALPYTGNLPKISKALAKVGGFDFPEYEVFCSKLKAANARLTIVAEHGVIGGKSIAWASVSVSDLKYSIHSALESNDTEMNDFADNGKSIELLGNAINGSLDQLDIDKAIDSLNEARKAIHVN